MMTWSGFICAITAALGGLELKKKNTLADGSIAASLIKDEHDSKWGTLMKGTDSW